MILILTFILSIVVVVCLYLTHYKTSDASKRAPGPWKLPVVGHLPFLGPEPYKTFLKWKQLYGPVISVQFGNQSAIVLTDYKLIKEAFTLPAVAERPRIQYFGKVSRGYKGVIFGFADTALEQRHFIIRILKDVGFGKNTMEEKIMEEVKEFMKELEDEVNSAPPEGRGILMNDRFQANVVSSFLSIFMSKRFSRTDPEFSKILDATHCAIASPGVIGEMAIFMPWLAQLIPGYSGLNRRKAGFHALYDFAETEIQKRNESRIPDHPRDFTDAYLDKVDATNNEKSTFHKDQNYQPVSTADFLLGALHTTSTALEWLLIQLVRNPAVQNRVFEEVSHVTSGNSRYPSIADRIHMPYTEAVVHELLRANTLGATGLLHSTSEDVSIGGYFVPKGTMVVANFWGIHNDPENWEEPSIFKPERFLEERDGILRVKRDVNGYFPFSHGKRVCPGKPQALDSLFLFTASLSQKFIFECWQDQMPSLEMNYGFVQTPNKFRIQVSLRQR